MVKVGTIITENGKQYELVPPEGGWGYLSCLALIIFTVVAFSSLSSFGMIYNDFLEERNEGSSGIALVSGVSAVTLALAGFGANILLKKFSLRQVGLIGAGLYSTGMFLGIFVQSSTHMMFTSGLLQYGGIGTMLPIVYTSFNSYFTQKRMFLLSISKFVVGIAYMVAPTLIKVSLQEFGFRGTLALMAAVGFHSILAAILLQPVEWHLVRREILLKTKSENDVIERDGVKNVDGNTALLCDHGKPESDDKEAQRRSLTPIAMLCNENQTHKSMDSEEREMDNLIRAVSIASLGTFPSAVVEPLPSIKSKSGNWKAVVDFLDLSLLKDLVYVNIIFGISITMCSDLTYFMYLPLMMYKMNWSKSQVALAISLSAGTDMLGRLSIAMIARFKTVPSRTMFMVAVVLTFGIRILFETSENAHVMMALIGLLGYFRAFFHVMMPLVVAEHVPIKQYPAAFGLVTLTYGFMNLTAGPVIGLIRDYTQSYHIAFHTLTAILLVCVIPWSLEFYSTRRKCKHVGKN